MKKIISTQHNKVSFNPGVLTKFSNEKGETFGLFLYDQQILQIKAKAA
jgi:hypothetical protein